jgi:hypothetical protein
LYAALLSATEKDGMFKLEGKLQFPVEPKEQNGDCLIVRQSQKDLWSIIDGELLNKKDVSIMVIVGPAGSGKVRPYDHI